MCRQFFSNTFFLRTLIGCFLGVVLLSPAHSAMVGTASLGEEIPGLAAELLAEKRTLLHQQLIEYGVTSDEAVERIDQLTSEEVITLSSSLEEAPAGGGFLTVAAVVFLVLLATDILGYTDIFPFVINLPM